MNEITSTTSYSRQDLAASWSQRADEIEARWNSRLDDLKQHLLAIGSARQEIGILPIDSRNIRVEVPQLRQQEIDAPVEHLGSSSLHLQLAECASQLLLSLIEPPLVSTVPSSSKARHGALLEATCECDPEVSDFRVVVHLSSSSSVDEGAGTPAHSSVGGKGGAGDDSSGPGDHRPSGGAS